VWNRHIADATATITFVGTPTWTLTKSADPTTYSGPSQPIAYSYVLTNTGNVAINSIVLNDDKAGAANCPSTSLAVRREHDLHRKLQHD